MANTRELRRRIRSVKNTAQITKAMQMVAATKMRRAQTQALNGRPYVETLTESLSNLTLTKDSLEHPLFKPNQAKKIGIILLSTDKSLCGALNTNLFRAVINFSKDHSNLTFYTVGKKGRDFIVRTGQNLEADFENPEKVDFGIARQIAKLTTENFLKAELAEVYVAFPYFVSTLNQQPRIVKLLPTDPSVISNVSERSQDEKQISPSGRNDKNKSAGLQTYFLFEPNPTELLNFVLNHFIENQIYSSMIETKASEHAARMMAMQNATQNAQDLVSDLELSYNQIRQNSITQEILEITTAGMTLQ